MSTYHILETLRAVYMSLVLCYSGGNRTLSQNNEDLVGLDNRKYELPSAPKKRVGPSTS